MKFEIFKDRSKQWRFNLVADNGKVVATSESYKSKYGMKKGIACIKKGSKKAKILNLITGELE